MIERESFWQNGMQPAIEPQLFVKASPPQSDECLHANASVFLVGRTTQRSRLLCFAFGPQPDQNGRSLWDLGPKTHPASLTHATGG